MRIQTVAVLLPALAFADAAVPGARGTYKATTCGADNGKRDNTLVTPSGTRYQEIVVGKGETPSAGDLVSLRLNAWTTSGTRIEVDRAILAPFGRRLLIPALEDILATMRVGGHRRLYGPAVDGARIPVLDVARSADLVIEVELVAVQRQGASERSDASRSADSRRIP